jgi:hypothetical protein
MRIKLTFRSILNVVVPFLLGWLLAKAFAWNDWHFWIGMFLIIVYRGTRVEKIDG